MACKHPWGQLFEQYGDDNATSFKNIWDWILLYKTFRAEHRQKDHYIQLVRVHVIGPCATLSDTIASLTSLTCQAGTRGGVHHEWGISAAEHWGFGC